MSTRRFNFRKLNRGRAAIMMLLNNISYDIMTRVLWRARDYVPAINLAHKQFRVLNTDSAEKVVHGVSVEVLAGRDDVELVKFLWERNFEVTNSTIRTILGVTRVSPAISIDDISKIANIKLIDLRRVLLRAAKNGSIRVCRYIFEECKYRNFTETFEIADIFGHTELRKYILEASREGRDNPLCPR